MRIRASHVILGSLTVLILILIVALVSTGKQRALTEVVGSFFSDEPHRGGRVNCEVQALKARHNLDVIDRACEYVATLGSNTLIYMEIARIAAEADRECARLDAVLDLAVRQAPGGGQLLALAGGACRLETPEQERAWQEHFDAMMARTAYPDVESAVSAQRMK